MDLTKVASSIPALGGLGQAVGSAAPAAGAASFSDVLKTMVSDTIDAQKAAESMTIAASSGDNVALQDVIAAVSKAEVTLQTLVTVRDKAVEAYQQIMQMPV